MRIPATAVIVLAALSAGSALAQTRPWVNYAPLILQQQQQNTQQQMYQQNQINQQGVSQEHAASQQRLSTLSQHNQEQLNQQTPAPGSSFAPGLQH